MSRSVKNSGFTLIELTLYLAIFSSIIGSVVGLGIVATGQRVKSQAVAEVTYQGESALAFISQAVRDAISIASPSQGSSGSTLNLVMSAAPTNPTLFDTFTTGSATQLRVSEGSAVNRYFLTNSHVTMSGLNFSNVGLSGTKGSIKIQFTLNYLDASSRSEGNFSKTFYGGVTLP